jgi:6-pyruvoyltetrahydropterin/6-carboxytetrahydropterin synthase
MIMDFGLMKSTIGDFVDSFDHAYSMWDKESGEFKDFIYNNSARVINMPVSPSAEAYSLMMFKVIDAIVKNTEFNNGEQDPEVHAVRVHETQTGYAESRREDMDWVDWGIEDITFSQDIKDEWRDPAMWDKLLNGEKFVNDIVEQQV